MLRGRFRATEGTNAHTGGTSTCENKARCAVCGKEYGKLADHTYVDGECECGETAPNYTHVTSPGVNEPDPDNTGGHTDRDDGLGAGAIAGIAVGSTAAVGLVGFSLFWFVIKKKKWSDLIGIFKK